MPWLAQLYQLTLCNPTRLPTVPPDPPAIYEGQGRMPEEGVIGPFKENDTARLLCVAATGEHRTDE